MFLYCTALFGESDDSGDSYSATEYDVDGPRPSALNPLGNPAYPGTTWSGGPNWVALSFSSLIVGGAYRYGLQSIDNLCLQFRSEWR
jgi:hypothetical protein